MRPNSDRDTQVRHVWTLKEPGERRRGVMDEAVPICPDVRKKETPPFAGVPY
jgi:hypothetical protein